MIQRAFLLVMIVIVLSLHGFAQDRKTKVLLDRTRILQDGFWIYNNVDKGMEEARKSGKPLLVIFRCIPCEACAQLDEQVVENNPEIRKQLGRFVCVRVVHTNGMDLSRFQFDYDQSWAAFFLNADGTIYGRYGTRSHERNSDDDVTLDGFLDTMASVLKLHGEYPGNRESLLAKTGPQVAIARPEDLPMLKAQNRYSSELDYQGKVVESCIHCHQVGEAWRQWHRASGKPIAAEVMFPYPHPKLLGLVMDPTTATTVKHVQADSVASKAGFKSGDKLAMLDGQPIVSVADVQWVLHRCGSLDHLDVSVDRGGQRVALKLDLPAGWRETSDISWRATSWALRRMVTGGLRLESVTDAERKELGLDKNAVGLRVKHVGQFNAHAAAKRAGFKSGDIFVSVDGISQPMTETQLFARLMTGKRVGDSVSVEVWRENKRRTLELPIQE